jgi:hypothetical protein
MLSTPGSGRPTLCKRAAVNRFLHTSGRFAETFCSFRAKNFRGLPLVHYVDPYNRLKLPLRNGRSAQMSHQGGLNGLYRHETRKNPDIHRKCVLLT